MRKLFLLQLLVINSFTNQVAKGQLDESCISGFPSETEIISGGRECNSQTDEDSSEPSNNCFKERTGNSNGGYSTRIIPDLRVTCNGTLTGWRAAGEMTNRETSPLLQIWRKIDGQQERYQREGDSIPLGSCNGRSELQEISTNSRYYKCILEASVSVRTGDIVGLVLPRERDTSFRLYFIDESATNYVYRFHPLTVFPDPSQRGRRRERRDNSLPLITLMIDQEQTTTEPTSTTNHPMTEEHTTARQTTTESTTGEATVEITSTESTIGEPTTVTAKPIIGESTTAQSTTGKVTTGEATNWETTVEMFTTESTTGESAAAKTSTGEPTNGEATTREATNWETTLETTIMESTTGKQTTKEPTIEISITGNAITRESTTWEPTTTEPSTEEPTSNAEKPSTTQQTTGEATTVKPTTEESTTAKMFTEESITSEASTVELTTEQQSTAPTIIYVQSTTMEPIPKETTIAYTESTTMEEPTTTITTTGETTSEETTSRELTTGQLHATTEQPTTMEPTTTDGQLITETSTVDTATGELTTLEPTTAEIHATTVETTIPKQTTLEQTNGTTVVSELTTVELTISPSATGESITTTKMPTTAKTTFKRTEVQPTTAIPSPGITTIGQSAITSVHVVTTSTEVLTQVAGETPPSSTLKPTVITKSKADSIHSIARESSQLISKSASASDQAQHVKSSSAATLLKLSSSVKLIIAKPMSTTAASNYHTIHTLTTTVHTSSIEPTSVNPTTVVKAQSTNTNSTAKPTAIKPQPTKLTNFNAGYTASTAVTPTGTELSSATPVWKSIQDRSTVMEEQIIVTMLDSTVLVTASPDGLPSSKDTLDITYNTGIFFGDPENTTAISVGGLLIIVVVVILVIVFFILKRYRKKHTYRVHWCCPAYTNPITESINVTVNPGADNSSAASQPEQKQISPGKTTNNIYNDLSKPPYYEEADRTYMHLYSVPRLPAEDTEYTVINTCTLEDSRYYQVPFNNNS